MAVDSHVALHPGDLPRQKNLGVVQKIEVGRQNTRRVDKGVAVDGAQAHEFGLLQARDEPEDPFLRPVLQLGLEAHQVVERAFPVFGPELDYREGLAAGSGPPGPRASWGRTKAFDTPGPP